MKKIISFLLILISSVCLSFNCFAEIPDMEELYEEIQTLITADNLFNGPRYNLKTSTIRNFLGTNGTLWGDQVPEEFWGISAQNITGPTLYKWQGNYYLLFNCMPYTINYIGEDGANKTITIYGIFDSDAYYVKDKIVLVRYGSRAKYDAYYFDEEGIRSEAIKNSNGEAVKFDSNGKLISEITSDPGLDEEDDELGGVALTTNNPAKQKAQQVAARRTACMSALIAATNNDGMNSITTNDSSAADNEVNLNGAFLFADECVYPFSYFNWPQVADKKQFYVWINMENNLNHANWICIETKTTQPVCYKDHGEGECHLDTTPKIDVKQTVKKCSQPEWEPPLYFSFGRDFDFSTPGFFNLGISASNATHLQDVGHWVAGGALLYYPVYWSPVHNGSVWENYIGSMFTDFNDMMGNMIRHRIWGAGEKLIKEVKKYGGDQEAEEGETENSNGVVHNIEDFVDYEALAQEFWDNEVVNGSSGPDYTLANQSTGSHSFNNSNVIPTWSHTGPGKLTDSQKESVINYVKENHEVTEDDLDFDWDE